MIPDISIAQSVIDTDVSSEKDLKPTSESTKLEVSLILECYDPGVPPVSIVFELVSGGRI